MNNIFEKVKKENEFLINENKNFNENLEHFKNLKIEEKNEGNNINTDIINNINEISDENNSIKDEMEKLLEESQKIGKEYEAENRRLKTELERLNYRYNLLKVSIDTVEYKIKSES